MIIKEMFRSAFLGVTIGLVSSLCFCYTYGVNYQPSSPAFTAHFSNTNNAMVVSMILWMLIGIASYFSSLIFKIEKWSLLKRTILHGISIYIEVLLIGICAGWFTLDNVATFGFTFFFLLIYVVIWIIMMIHYRYEIHQINNALHK